LENSLNSDWRVPSDSEKEIIAAWTLNKRLNHSTKVTKGVIVELSFVGIVFLLASMRAFPFNIIPGALMLVVFLLMIFSNKRRDMKLLHGDYLIMDSFVIEKEVSRHQYGKTLSVYVKVPYGMNRYFRVSSSVYNAVTAGTPGFLIRYDTKKPVHQGTAKMFFPAIPVE